MTHIAFQPDGPDIELYVDYVVVGSGAGGATAAINLARAGEQVAIVEAGPWRDPQDYPYSTYGAFRDMMNDWGTSVSVGKAMWPIVQARLVGGTTVINSAICVRTPGDIFDEWQRDYGVGGAFMADAVWRNQDQIEAELCVEEVPQNAFGRANQLAMIGDRIMGYEGYVMKRYTKGCVGSGQCLQGCKNMRKQSMNVTYIPEVMALKGTVLSCAPVSKVLFEGQRAVGVTGFFQHPKTQKKGVRFNVRAKKGVLMAASVTHTPIILMSSGVKNNNLGRFYRAHPGVGVLGVYDQLVDMNHGATQGWASTYFRLDQRLKLETLALPFEMVAGRLSGGGQVLVQRTQQYRHLIMLIAAVRAESIGKVINFLGKPVVYYTVNKRDMLRLREGVCKIAKMHFASGARSVISGIHGMPYSIGPDEVEKMHDAPLDPRNYVGIQSHLFGGAVMGTDEKQSVCDRNGQVHGYKGLWVVDASLLPSTLGVNPQHTIMGMAKYVVDRILNS